MRDIFSPAMAQASSLLGLSSSTLPLSDVGEGAEGGDRVVNLTISWSGMTDICMGYLLRDSWMITAAHCFASGLPLENYAISGSAGKGAVEEIFFRKNVDIALVRLNGEFEVSGCAPLTPSPTRSGESVEAVLRGGKQVVPFVIQSENHIASNPSINVAAHPMLSLFPGEGGRLTKPGESGPRSFQREPMGINILKGLSQAFPCNKVFLWLKMSIDTRALFLLM